MSVGCPDLNGKLAGAGLLMAASMRAGVVMLAGVSVREAGGEARARYNALSSAFSEQSM